MGPPRVDKRRPSRTRRVSKCNESAVVAYAVQPQSYEECSEALRALIDEIPSVDPERFPSVIKEALRPENVGGQEAVIRACLKRLLYCANPESEVPEPHTEQVRTLRRLIFYKGDTLLVARTGFGKSIIFHAYTVLIGKMTIQIILLNTLGNEQLESIRRLPGTNWCLINHETLHTQRGLRARILAGEFTHVLLGPE